MIKFDEKVLGEIKKKLDISKDILLICHKKPDADAIGSVLALDIALRRMGKNVTCCSIDAIPSRYYFLPGIYRFQDKFNDLVNYDLIVIVDCGDHKMTGFHGKTNLFKTNTFIINIDHHISNDLFGNINVVFPEASSTTHIIFSLFKQFRISICEDIATLLMAGIYYDTGSFKHDNTTPEIFLVAEQLSRLGARTDLINKYLFKTQSIETLNIWGEILKKIKINDKNIVSCVVTKKDLEKYKLDENNINYSNIMNLMDSIPEATFSILLTENNDMIKGSFRTHQENIDVSKIAKYFNGGGHKKASGFVMNGNIIQIEDNINKIL